MDTSNFGTPDTILFALVIVSTAGAGFFQGWFEAYTQDEPQRQGLALPKGKGPFWDFLYLLVLTCSVPLILGNKVPEIDLLLSKANSKPKHTIQKGHILSKKYIFGVFFLSCKTSLIRTVFQNHRKSRI